MGSKKHKKHKSERKEHRGEHFDYRPHGLKLILKVAGSSTSTPEHADSPGGYISDFPPQYESREGREKHKKSKKKKKKKEKDREKRHKHHKEKRRIKEDSSQEDFSFSEETSQNPFYTNLTTTHSVASKPVTKPMVPLKSPEPPPSIKLDESSIQSPSVFLQSPLSQSSSSKLDTRDSLSPRPLSSDGGREPRSCVLKLKQSRSPIAKLLEHLIKALEKRDPHQFFAWPVTDDIAPNYSSIISKPMDFSTIREKINENEYKTIGEFSDDFKLMCENAIKYNHPETVYHKAAKRLLHVGQRLLQPENLVRSLRPLVTYMRELTPKELGFELPSGSGPEHENEPLDSADEAVAAAVDEGIAAQEEEEEKRKQIRLENNPKGKFEPFVDDMTPDEILAQVQSAAAKAKVLRKKVANQMGFIRQRKDGTTSMKILVADENEGPEKVITIGALLGKLKSGTGQLHSFREDRRNVVKPVKTLNYGGFCSFAPVFDSRFAQLNKEETDLVLNTYGDETGYEYAKSITDFAQDSSYASLLANGLLDVLTNGEHRKTMTTLVENSRQRHEQKEIEKSIPTDDEKYLGVKVDFESLRSLGDLGIETNFVEQFEMQTKMIEFQKKLQSQLDSNLALLEQLHQVQHDRLSAPPPMHLSHIQHPSPNEIQLANQITSNIVEISKQLPPGAIADPHGLRKAMGLTSIGLDPVYDPNDLVVVPPQMNSGSTNGPSESHGDDVDQIDTTPMDMELEDSTAASQPMDIDTELRDILEDF